MNADDFGHSRRVTDPVLAAYDEGLISSTSAMVWMPDSERAAVLARERDMPVGLHLNLTLPFRDEHVPSLARELQAELATVFDATSWNEDDVRQGDPDPRIREAVDHQLGAFRAQFGEPSHLDGHHHIHVHPAVLRCLPREFPVRPVLRTPHQLGLPRDGRDRLLRKFFRTADGCVGLRQIHPAFGGVGLDALAFSHDRILEVMVHAQFDEEQQALYGAEWRTALSALELGSYRNLRRG